MDCNNSETIHWDTCHVSADYCYFPRTLFPYWCKRSVTSGRQAPISHHANIVLFNRADSCLPDKENSQQELHRSDHNGGSESVKILQSHRTRLLLDLTVSLAETHGIKSLQLVWQRKSLKKHLPPCITNSIMYYSTMHTEPMQLKSQNKTAFLWKCLYQWLISNRKLQIVPGSYNPAVSISVYK